ncbi:MAG TPA: TonB family protein [Pyrinomonadaceae bacterium]|nr:TonB family protein [Pyrinomonadaceae bacterium]
MRETIVGRMNAKDIVLIVVLALLMMSGSVLTAAAQSRELSLADVLIALRSKKADASEKNKLLSAAIKQRGVTFSLTPEIEKELGSTGADADLIGAIRSKALPMPSVSSVVQSEQKPAEVKPVEDFAFFRSRASAEIASGDRKAALNDLTKAIEMKADDPGVRHDRAMLLAMDEKFADAAAEYTKAIELAPTDARNYAGRAAVYEKLLKPVDALQDYQKVLTIAPADQSASASVIRITSQLTRLATEAAAAKQAETKADKPAEPTASPNNTSAPAPSSKGADTVADKTPSVANIGDMGPYCLDAVKPKYPQSALSMRAQGEVLVRVSLDENGKVVEAKANNGNPSLRAAAENAVQLSKFKPVTQNGKPVRATGYLTYKFVL